MQWFDGFPFKSKEKIRKEKEAFERRMLPLGQEQKARALAMMQELMEGKVPDTELLFAYFTAKDRYLTYIDEGMDVAMEMAGEGLERPTTRLNAWNRHMVVALVRLEDGISSLEEYPTKEAVAELATK